jgi:hypothetical protein
MPRPLAFALLVAVAAVAAPVPKKPAKDYQKLADETGWVFAERKAITDSLEEEFKGFRAELLAFEGIDMTVRIANAKKEELLKWQTHVEVSFAQRNGVFYYTDFSPYSSGCRVVAFDLTAKKQLWKAELKGLGGIDHSKYRNEVRMEVLDDDTLRVFGKESAGRYVEIVDRSTGKTVGHKVSDEKK